MARDKPSSRTRKRTLAEAKRKPRSARPASPRSGVVATAAAPVDAAQPRQSFLEHALGEVLTPSFWFDAGERSGGPYSITVTFSGRRVSGDGAPSETFRLQQTFSGIMPGSGPVSLTPEVRGVTPGEWEVRASAVRDRRARRGSPAVRAPERGGGRGLWRSRGLALVRAQPQRLRTALGPLAPIPGIRQLVWAPLVFLGIAVGVAVQALLLAHAHRDATAALAISASAVIGGWIGAKAWYAAVHRGRRLDGWCVQGAILGGIFGAAVVWLLGASVPLGAYLNAAAPGLMLGIAAGKPGCFWAGCCVGRPTASRWGIWSSDRHVGINRIPTQFLEALLALIVGAVALVIVLRAGVGNSGWLLLGALSAYTLGRQFILPLRAEARRTRLGRSLTIATASAALLAAVVVNVA